MAISNYRETKLCTLITVDLLFLHIREIFRLLDLMKIDAFNYEVDYLRPLLQSMSVECERSMFQRVLDKTPSKSVF